ncbi:interleukin-1 receptor-associated kinase-like 2 isoform X2 [Pogona vitticeps]
MAMQQHPPPPPPPPLSLPARSPAAPPSPYLHSLPAWVLEDFCRKMDCLNEYDWMRFASYVITDQTELRKIKCMEKAGISITRELMWWWGMRLATVQQLLELLQELQLYQAAQVIAEWKSVSPPHDSVWTPQQKNASLHPTGNKNKDLENGLEAPVSQNSDSVLNDESGIIPLSPLLTSMDLPHSLRSNPPNVKPCSTSIPQQENMPNQLSDNLLWTPNEVETATDGFSEENRLSESIFSIAYKGRRDNALCVVKRLKEKSQTQRFFRIEVQICFRCCHPNILRLLGFCVESGFHCLIYPYMSNGSLADRLQCQEDSASLTWEKRTSISLGLIQAVQHLHHFGIIHGNIKSSNVLLDANFVPQLGHSGLRLHPVEKKSDYAMVKTKVLQASLAYFPEDFIRHGQLTEKVDIFGCGIVLAEILTGMKAMDEGRHPVFLKDAILEEIQLAKELLSSKEKTFERFAAIEICHKYQDKHAGCLATTAATWLATAVCVCLRKKNANMAEVKESVEMADRQIQYHQMPEGNRCFRLSVNTPEETNDEPTTSLNVGFSGDHSCEGRVNSEPLNDVDLLPPLIRTVPHETNSEQLLQIPCESDEYDSFSWDHSGNACCRSRSLSNGHPHFENISLLKHLNNDAEYTSDFTAKKMDSDRSMEPQEATASSSGIVPSHRGNSSATCSSEVTKEIEINNKKKKLMEQILLYKEKKINSYELFESSL